MNDISGTELSDQTDGELLFHFAQRGYQPAFSELIRRHGPMVLRMCRRVAGRDIALAEDASQQVFLALASNAAALSTRSTIAGWLYRTAWHVMTRLRRQRSTRAKHECQAAEFQAAAANQNGDAIPFAVATSEFSEALGRALATLPEQYRDAIVLHHFAGHTVDETAKILDVKTGTVASWLSRSRSMLRTRLDGFGAVVSTDAIDLWMNSHANDRQQASRALDACEARRLAPFKEPLTFSVVPASAVASFTPVGGLSVLASAKWAVAAFIGLGISGTAMAAAGGPDAVAQKIAAILRIDPAKQDGPRPKTAPPVNAPKDSSKTDQPGQRGSSHFGSGGSPIPEPATGAMLFAVGSMLLATRRRRWPKGGYIGR